MIEKRENRKGIQSSLPNTPKQEAVNCFASTGLLRRVSDCHATSTDFIRTPQRYPVFAPIDLFDLYNACSVHFFDCSRHSSKRWSRRITCRLQREEAWRSSALAEQSQRSSKAIRRPDLPTPLTSEMKDMAESIWNVILPHSCTIHVALAHDFL